MLSPLYPLKFTPIYKEKTWGGRGLEKFGRTLPGDASTAIGESWEICDLPSSTPGGGGGGPERSVICNGPLEGTTLNDILRDRGSELLGGAYRADMTDFPLLVKILDVNELLSLQVHPDADYVAAHPHAFLKSEAWYILDAGPNAQIYRGTNDGVTPQELRAAAATGDMDTVTALLPRESPEQGDCYYMPGGTLHAGGNGVLAFEVQTASDTTFRVFDWGRTDRELHLDQAMECVRFEPPQAPDPGPVVDLPHGGSSQQIVDCEHFRIVRTRNNPDSEHPWDHSAMVIWFVLEGNGLIDTESHAGTVPFAAGETILFPSAVDRAVVRIGQETTRLEVTIP